MAYVYVCYHNYNYTILKMAYVYVCYHNYNYIGRDNFLGFEIIYGFGQVLEFMEVVL
jgi:hypothetical protein